MKKSQQELTMQILLLGTAKEIEYSPNYIIFILMRSVLLCAVVILIIGLFKLPIGYYTFLRIAVTIASITIILERYSGKVTFTFLVLAMIAILYNPLIPVYLHNRPVWSVINVVTIGLFIFIALKKWERSSS